MPPGINFASGRLYYEAQKRRKGPGPRWPGVRGQGSEALTDDSDAAKPLRRKRTSPMGRANPVGSIRAECGQGGCVYPGSEVKGQWTCVFAVERFT